MVIVNKQGSRSIMYSDRQIGDLCPRKDAYENNNNNNNESEILLVN